MKKEEHTLLFLFALFILHNRQRAPAVIVDSFDNFKCVFVKLCYNIIGSFANDS